MPNEPTLFVRVLSYTLAAGAPPGGGEPPEAQGEIRARIIKAMTEAAEHRYGGPQILPGGEPVPYDHLADAVLRILSVTSTGALG